MKTPDPAFTDEPPGTLLIAIDGAAKGNPGPAGIGVVLMDELGKTVAEIARPIGTATNNVAEYRALITALTEARQRGAKRVLVQTDSQLLACQIRGEYKVSAAHLRALHREALALAGQFEEMTITHTLRAGNARADALANQGARSNPTTAPERP